MTLSICIVLCFIASLYSSTAAGDLAETCVSFDANRNPFLNVKWNFTNSANITVNGLSQVYNGTNATNIPLNVQTDKIIDFDVTVCDQNNASSCHVINTVVGYIYDATWKRINNKEVEVTCEVACRTPSISGCSVVLGDGGASTNIVGSIANIGPRFVTVAVKNLDPMQSYNYRAGAIVIVNRTSITSPLVNGIVPQLIISPRVSSVTTTYAAPSTTTTTTFSIPVVNTGTSPTTTNIMSVSPTDTVAARPRDDDDGNDSSYLPVIIAASCACILLLLIAIVLIVIIVRVKGRGKDSSNLSSPSPSKINNYDDLGDVKYFPISESQTNIQKTQSSSEVQNQEDLHRNKTPEYDLPVFTSVEKTPVVASYNLLNVSDTTYDSPDDALNPKSESSSPPTEVLYDPVSMEEPMLKSDSSPKSPVEEYDKLVRSPPSQGAVNLPLSIYDTLDEESLRNHYEFPDKDDENGAFQSIAPLRTSTAIEDEYSIPQTL